MKIVGADGHSPQELIKRILLQLKLKLDTQSGKKMQAAMQQTIRQHFQTKYPGSTHYSPNNVQPGHIGGNSAVEVIDVPGITRAYHDIDITPKNASKLKIPVHWSISISSVQSSALQGDGLFYVETKSGAEMLAKNEGGALAVMYILKDRVHQRQDPSLMPSDKTLADNISAKIFQWLKRS